MTSGGTEAQHRRARVEASTITPPTSTPGVTDGPMPPGPETGPHGPVIGPDTPPRERGRLDIKVALIGAVATIVAAVIGGIVAIQTDTIDVTLRDQTVDREELASTASSLQQTNDSLVTANADLEDQLDRATSTTSTPRTTATTADDGGGTTGITTTAAGAQSVVKRQTGDTPLSFTWGYSADLDSEDANWDVVRGEGLETDLYVGSSGRVYMGEVAIVDHVPTEAECRDTTIRQSILPEELSVAGTMACIVTDDDHRAFVRIVALDEEQQTATFDVTVWQ